MAMAIDVKVCVCVCVCHTGTITPLLLVAAIKKRNPAFLGPLIPLSFVWAYQYDFVFGTPRAYILSTAIGMGMGMEMENIGMGMGMEMEMARLLTMTV